MKIAIISDSHDNLTHLKKALDWLKKEKIKILIHCGDVCSPGTLKELLRIFPGRVFLVFGNVDGDRFGMAQISFDKKARLKIFDQLGELRIGGKKIGFCHFPRYAKALAQTQEYDLVFYGHSHRPWLEKIGRSQLVNPGELAGLYYKSSFAVYDGSLDSLELKVLEKL